MTSAASVQSAGCRTRRPALPRRKRVRYPLEGYRERCDTDVALGTRFAKNRSS